MWIDAAVWYRLAGGEWVDLGSECVGLVHMFDGRCGVLGGGRSGGGVGVHVVHGFLLCKMLL